MGGPIKKPINAINTKDSSQPIVKIGRQASIVRKSADNATPKRFFIGCLLQHRHLDTVSFRRFNGDLIPRVGVSDDAHAWVRCQDSFQSPSRFWRPVCHDNLSRVLGVSHAHAPTMMEGDPRRATNRIDHGIEDRPIRDRVRAVFHCFGLAVR